LFKIKGVLQKWPTPINPSARYYRNCNRYIHWQRDRCTHRRCRSHGNWCKRKHCDAER